MGTIIEKGSQKNTLSNYDKVSGAIYGAIFGGAVLTTEIINQLLPFLKLDYVVLNTPIISLNIGNLVSIVIAILAVFIKKYKQDHSNISVQKSKDMI